MRVLSDCPDRVPELAPGGWSEARVASLSVGDQALWRALARVTGSGAGPVRTPAPGVLVACRGRRGGAFLAVRHAAGGARRDLALPGPIASVALSGRGFHGQRGRPWLSPSGNLHLCAVLPGPGLTAREARSLPMLPAVALVDAVRDMTGGALRPGIKWVNDVLLDGRKIGGVLTATQTQGDRVSSVLLGIGLNVETAPAVPPTPFVPSVGCLADAGTPVAVTDAVVCVLAALGRRMTDLVGGGPRRSSVPTATPRWSSAGRCVSSRSRRPVRLRTGARRRLSSAGPCAASRPTSP